MEQRIYDTYVHLLERELVPAMGCTEPIAVAYAAAVATRELGVLPETVDISVSANIIKNVKGVTVPNTGGLHGLKAATAAGIIAGDPESKLLVISQVTKAQQMQIAEYLKQADFNAYTNLTYIADSRHPAGSQKPTPISFLFVGTGKPSTAGSWGTTPRKPLRTRNC